MNSYDPYIIKVLVTLYTFRSVRYLSYNLQPPPNKMQMLVDEYLLFPNAISLHSIEDEEY